MMKNLELLSSSTHKALKIAPLAVGINNHFIEVFIEEASELAKEMPLFFIKDSDTGQFNLITLLGLNIGENLLFSQGQWQVKMLPLKIQSQPFYYLPTSNEHDEFDIVIDCSDPRVQTTVGQPLFDRHGATAYLQNKLKQLAAIYHGFSVVDEFVKVLLTHQLISPLDLHIQLENGETSSLQGLYTIDKSRLNALGDHQVLQLTQAHYFTTILSIASSTCHVKRLINLKNRQRELLKA